MRDINEPLSFVTKAIMRTELEYTGSISLLELIEMGYLDEGDVQNQEAIDRAIFSYSKNLDGGEFVEREGMSSGWDVVSTSLTQ